MWVGTKGIQQQPTVFTLEMIEFTYTITILVYVHVVCFCMMSFFGLCYRFHVYVTVRSTVAASVGEGLSGLRARPASCGVIINVFGYVQNF